MNRLRLAVIGAGHLGRIHARIAAGHEDGHEDVQLVAIADPVAGARDTVAAETGAAAIEDYRTLLGESDFKIDAAGERS